MQHLHRSQASTCCHCCGDMIETTAGLAGCKSEPSAPPVLSTMAVTSTTLVLIETGSVLDFVLDQMRTFGRAVKWTGTEANGIPLYWSSATTCSPSARRKTASFCVGQPVLLRLCPFLSLLFLSSLSCEERWDRGQAGSFVCCTDRQQIQDHIMKL